MRIVLDTNVLVSGLLNPHNPPGEIVRMTSAGHLQLCHDARILSEYKEVLARPKFDFNQEHVDALLTLIKAVGHSVAAEPLQVSLPDPADEPFLAVAISGNASCLVTGNQKHFPSSACKKMKVLQPADFLEFYRQSR